MKLFEFPLNLSVGISWENGCFVFRVCHIERASAQGKATHIDSFQKAKEFTMDLQVGGLPGTILNYPRSADGQDRQVDGAIVCVVSPEGIVELVPSADGATCDVRPIAEGSAIYSCSADAALGPAVRTIESNRILISVAAAPIPEADHIESVEAPAATPQ
jgi:hypothetical protein